jgi:hypothetical protein
MMDDLFAELKGDLKAEEKKVERALFFCHGDDTYLLHAVGGTIECDLEAGLVRESEAGPWSEIPKEDGLWIWEGIPGWFSSHSYEHGDDGGEPNYSTGKARRPTPDELNIIINGPVSKLFGPSALGPGDEPEAA